jgi:hypothetical protein
VEVTVIYTSLFAGIPVIMSNFSHLFKYTFPIYVFVVGTAAPTSVYLILDMGDWKEICVINSW